LNIVSLEWLERTIGILLFNINFNDNVILDSVVLWVYTSPLFTSLFIFQLNIECSLPCDASFKRALKLLFVGKSTDRVPGRT
jgi:hypothetical protein